MIPRGTIDIGWSDLLHGIGWCVGQSWQDKRTDLEETCWPNATKSLACLSVRSGLDLLLRALSFPQGTQVLISAITIPEMVTILQHHGLEPIPVDIDPDTLSIDQQSLHRCINGKSKVLLIAHLFGSRMNLSAIIEFAHQHGLFVIEDCAQAYVGSDFSGHPESDASLFSFGPIKTSTALGGGILHFKDNSLRNKVKKLQEGYPIQPTGIYVHRLLKACVLKGATIPWVYTIIVFLLQVVGLNHDTWLSNATRGFPETDFFEQIRQRPAFPMLKLLRRRIYQNPGCTITKRRDLAKKIISVLPPSCILGKHTKNHAHWVLPIQTKQPEDLCGILWKTGIDATRKGSSLEAINVSGTSSINEKANGIIEKIIFLPFHPSLTDQDIRRLGKSVRKVEGVESKVEVRLRNRRASS